MNTFVLTIFDLLFTPFLLLFIFFVGNYIRKKNERQQPLYKWYTRGLMVKCFGAIAVCLIYQFYYKDGDTVNYFMSSQALVNLFSKNSSVFFDIMKGNTTWENYSVFDNNTGYCYMMFDKQAMVVVRLIVPLIMVSFQSFMVSSILLAWICYTGIWRLFLLFNEEFPALEKQFAISILFIPSVVFWGSGLLKDTITLSAVGWFTYSFYEFFIKKHFQIKFLIFIFIASFLLVSIKPYILFALLPGSVIWLVNERLVKLKSKFLRMFLAPFFIATGVALGFFILTKMGDTLGDYSVDKVLTKAVVSNKDQKSEYYGGNSFDIGEFDATAGSIARKAHLAIAATLFRPTLFDARNPVMLLSALENTYIMLLTLFLLMRLKFFGFFTLIGEKPLLLFSVIFSLFFAFSVGIATSNFGSLVRLKIPCIPFFVSSLFVLRYLYEQKFKKKLGV
jgi:hypothetical protein